MTIEGFWKIIDAVHSGSGGDMERKCGLLKERLLALDEEELSDFMEHFNRMDAEAYTWPLWAAAEVMNGGCGDDAFSDFRASLISHGREIYARALGDPDSLVEVDTGSEDLFHEGFQYVSRQVGEQRGNRPVDRMMAFPEEPSGAEWKPEDLPLLLPRLSARYDPELPDKEDQEVTDPGTVMTRPWWKFW